MHSEETLLRAIEMMRAAASATALLDSQLISRNGHKAVAESMQHTAQRIGELSARDILAAALAVGAADQAEAEAFEQEGRRLGFIVVRRDNGELFHPISKRAWEIWQAGVRWAQIHKKQ